MRISQNSHLQKQTVKAIWLRIGPSFEKSLFFQNDRTRVDMCYSKQESESFLFVDIAHTVSAKIK
jgi:hypothetical protein